MPKKFEKGHQKAGGRQKGTPNKSTDELRLMLQNIAAKNFDKLEDDLNEMKVGMRWTVIEKLLKYFMPSLTKNENDNSISGGVDITISYADDADKNDVDAD